MNIFMTCLTKRDAIVDIVSKNRIIFPRSNVVCLDASGCAALPAGVFISFVNRISPTSVLPRVPLFIWVRLATKVIFAPIATILCAQMPTGWRERTFAESANKGLSKTIPTRISTAAAWGTCLRILDGIILKLRTTNDARLCRSFAFCAISTPKICGNEGKTASNATPVNSNLRTAKMCVGSMATAGLRSFVDKFFATIKRTRLLGWHRSDYSTFSTIQRWIDLTGKEPNLYASR